MRISKLAKYLITIGISFILFIVFNLYGIGYYYDESNNMVMRVNTLGTVMVILFTLSTMFAIVGYLYSYVKNLGNNPKFQKIKTKNKKFK